MGDPYSEWIVWRVLPPLNDKKIPERCPLQDFFPFGVYLPVGFSANYKFEGLKDKWEWFDKILADIKARGMNFTGVTNLRAAELDQMAALHAKHGLRMSPQVGEFSLKHRGMAALKPFLRAVEKYRGNPVIAGWAVGEEFAPKDVPQLDLPHEIVRAIDPTNTLVTIHNSTEAFRLAGQLLDIRIAFRDIYPFFSEPRCGPVGHEACMNYYEDGIDKAQRLLPQGASLWVLPQAQHEYYRWKDKDPQFVFRQPTPPEILLQAWAALAHGAQGLAYFLYPSSAPEKEGGIPHFLSLRTHDGKTTAQLEALTTLGKKIVPLGPIITRWERVRVPVSTNHRELRAYLFKREDIPYLVVFNHDPSQTVTGKVRLPFDNSKVFDLISEKEVKVGIQDNSTTFSITLPPGDGTIIRLNGTIPSPQEELQEAVDIPKVSGRPRSDLPLTDLPDGRKLFRYQINLQKTQGVPGGESISSDFAFQDWKIPGRSYMNGVYGKEVAFLLEMPDTITNLTVSGLYGNHRDNNPCTYRILYSVDGKAFEAAAERAEVGAGTAHEVKGTVSLPPNTHRVWVAYTFPARDKAIVLKSLDIQLVLDTRLKSN
jgi:hypothetical protein